MGGASVLHSSVGAPVVGPYAVSAPKSGRASSASLSPPGTTASSSSHLHHDDFNARSNSNGGNAPRNIRAGVVRNSSYDERSRTTAQSWAMDAHRDAVVGRGGGGGVAHAFGRPTDLRISQTTLFNHARHSSESGGVGGVGVGSVSSAGEGGTAGSMTSAAATATAASCGLRHGGMSTDDLTAMMCAEFALLTPTSALGQQKKQKQQARQSLAGMSPMKMWSPSWSRPANGNGVDSDVSGDRDASGLAQTGEVVGDGYSRGSGGSAKSSTSHSSGLALGSQVRLSKNSKQKLSNPHGLHQILFLYYS